MKGSRWLNAVVICLVGWTQLTGCSGLPGPWLGGDDPEVTPSPTTGFPEAGPAGTPGAVRVIPSPACRVAGWHTVQVSEPQGDLMAWSPDGSRLAFLRRQDKNGWYVGDLAVASGEGFQDLVMPAVNVDAWGDLTWSPDGTSLAFVALREDDPLYTVMVTRPDAQGAVDLFPGEITRSERWSSPKGIDGWSSEKEVVACIQCGPGCSQTAAVNVETGYRPDRTVRSSSAETGDLAACLTPTRGEPGPGQDFLAEDAGVDWSPDGRTAAYPDTVGRLWIYQSDQQTAFYLDLDRTVQETKWSPDGRMLAVRTETEVIVYKMGCK